MPARLRNPAVVLNSEAAGIGVIHALCRAGIDIISVERNWPPLLGRFSRFPKLQVFYRPGRGESVVDALLRLENRFEGKAVLYAGTDPDLEAIIAAQERLSARFHVPAAKHIGLNIFDKNWQYDIAGRAGVPTPRYVTFRGGERPDLHGLRFPLIAKPSSRTAALGHSAFRLQVLRSPAEAERCFEEVGRQYPGRAFQVAEDIPGGPDQLYSIGSYSTADGRVLRSYTGRKVSQYPYDHGTVSIAESLTVPHTLVDLTRALLEEARFHGISEVEFKLDPRDGLFKLIEINGRPWLWIKLASSSGINLPLIQHWDVTGDARLAQELTAMQSDEFFFVYEPHLVLNHGGADRSRLQELGRSKTLVPAIYFDGEWRLNAAYRVRSLLKRYWVQFAS